jgi:DNA-directed RNA polymerase subunit RPC12/RpoP
MDKTRVRCPYCVEDGNFKIMTRKGEGGWYVCAACTHTVVSDDSGYRCKCVKCTQVYELGRDV